MPPAPPPPSLTILGLVALSLAAVMVAAGLLLLSGPLLATGIAAGLFLLVCRSLATRHLGDFVVERDLPRRVRARESFPMELRLQAGPRFPRGVALRLTDPLAPTIRGRDLDPSTSAGRSIRCTGLATRRGPLPRRLWTMSSTWPLGLFYTERQGNFRDDHVVVVLPKPWLPSRLRERLEHLSHESAARPIALSDPAAEIRLLREFRNGDPVSGIHWPTSLRSGRLHYAETEPPLPKPLRYGLLLHSLEPPGTVITPETYELILRIATGLLMRFQREEIPVVFCPLPDQAALLAGRASFAEAIDRLALSHRHPISSTAVVLASVVGKKGADPFHGCDEVFVLSDCPLIHWEAAVRGRLLHCTCLDTSALTIGSRPGLLTRSRTGRHLT